MRSSPKENQSLEVKVKGISEMEFSLSIFDYTFTNYPADIQCDKGNSCRRADKSLCGWRDSNSQGVSHTPLKRACLPVPPHPLDFSLTIVAQKKNNLQATFKNYCRTTFAPPELVRINLLGNLESNGRPGWDGLTFVELGAMVAADLDYQLPGLNRVNPASPRR